MLHHFSSITSIRLYRLMSLLFMLLCVRLIHWDGQIVSGFEVSPRCSSSKRLNAPTNDQHQSVSSKESQSSNCRSSHCKYDLGLGKNTPLITNGGGRSADRQMVKDRGQPDQNTSIARTSDDNDNTYDSTYEACRFLVEHETARTYPAPDNNSAEDYVTKDRIDDCGPQHSFPTLKIPTASPNGKEDRNTRELEPAAKTTTKKTNSAFVRQRKSQHPARVQPRRLLEDCLTISDHELSDSNVSPPPGNSTIWSRPDTPQLDMNSVWVEMLLHNQMTQAQAIS